MSAHNAADNAADKESGCPQSEEVVQSTPLIVCQCSFEPAADNASGCPPSEEDVSISTLYPSSKIQYHTYLRRLFLPCLFGYLCPLVIMIPSNAMKNLPITKHPKKRQM
jgi:hypothetical protein